ncbi:MAG TPA: GGDEF domain-containing protein [Vicinamibacterales bacterium]|jgi:diguanylate cyclase (GGDEF)-like protein
MPDPEKPDASAGDLEEPRAAPPGAADPAIVDRLTTLYTRPVFEAALSKELGRASRFGLPLAVVLLDVDRLAAIDASFGFGVGDRILERLGILVRTYFREHDWVARDAEDAILVLLPHTEAGDALDLAERLRATVDERLAFRDHVSHTHVRVTVSGALVTISGDPGEPIPCDRIFTELETALSRAKQAGRNRVDHVHIAAKPSSVSDAERRR